MFHKQADRDSLLNRVDALAGTFPAASLFLKEEINSMGWGARGQADYQGWSAVTRVAEWIADPQRRPASLRTSDITNMESGMKKFEAAAHLLGQEGLRPGSREEKNAVNDITEFQRYSRVLNRSVGPETKSDFRPGPVGKEKPASPPTLPRQPDPVTPPTPDLSARPSPESSVIESEVEKRARFFQEWKSRAAGTSMDSLTSRVGELADMPVIGDYLRQGLESINGSLFDKVKINALDAVTTVAGWMQHPETFPKGMSNAAQSAIAEKFMNFESAVAKMMDSGNPKAVESSLRGTNVDLTDSVDVVKGLRFIKEIAADPSTALASSNDTDRVPEKTKDFPASPRHDWPTLGR